MKRYLIGLFVGVMCAFALGAVTYNGILPSTGGLRIGDSGVTNYALFATDGGLTFAGSARHTNSTWVNAGALKAPGAKPATAITHGTLETPAWQFADQAVEGNQETISFSIRIPERMDRLVAPTISLGVSTTTIYTDDSTVNETMSFQLEYLWSSENESTAAAAQEALAVSYTLTAATPAEGLRMLTFTGIDLPSETDVCVHCKVTRLTASTDTIGDAIELHGLCISWTSDKLGTGI